MPRPTKPARRSAAPARTPSRREAVLYARVSSSDQAKEGFSIPAQQRLLKEYAERSGFVVVEEFTDIETAKRAGRTNFVKMLAYLKKHAKSCQVILVEKTDRLYRNLKDWVTLDDLDLEIHLVKEGVVLSDGSRSSEKFMHGIKVLMAKNYIDNLSEEATKGMKEKAQQGIWPTKAPLGYRNILREDGKKAIEIDRERAPAIVQLFTWAATGNHSIQQLTKMAKEAGLRMKKSGAVVAKASIHRIVRNPLYTGDIHWLGEVYKGSHPALITHDLFDRVQDVLDGRYQGQRETERREEFAFVGLLTCGHCGCALSAQIQKQRYVYYHCTGFKGKCPEPYVREEVLADRFTDALRRLHFGEEVMELVRQSLRASHADQERHHREAIDRLESECARLQKRIDTAYLDKLDGVIDADFFQRKATDWREEQRVARRAILKHEDANQSYIEEGITLLDLGREAADLFAEQVVSEKRRLLNYMVSNSTWADGTLSVAWRQPFDMLEEMATAARETEPSEFASGGLPSRLVTPTGFELRPDPQGASSTRLGSQRAPP